MLIVNFTFQRYPFYHITAIFWGLNFTTELRCIFLGTITSQYEIFLLFLRKHQQSVQLWFR